MNTRLRQRALAPLLTALALMVGVPAAATPVEETPVTPADLERGENPAVPQVLGTTILDEDRRIDVPAQGIQLLGTAGDDYVVAAHGRHKERVLRIAPDGRRTTLLSAFTGDLTLSDDGAQLFETRFHDEESVVVVRDAGTGERLVRRAFQGYVRILDADDQRAVLSRLSPDRTFWWHVDTDETQRVSDREGYFADIPAGLVATVRWTSYEEGCSRLTTLADPDETLWRSCKDAVVAVSPSGRLATFPLFLDGPNPRMQVHEPDGTLLARYRTGYLFGSVVWEDEDTLLTQAHGRKKAVIARCTLDECERASRRMRT